MVIGSLLNLNVLESCSRGITAVQVHVYVTELVVIRMTCHLGVSVVGGSTIDHSVCSGAHELWTCH